MAKELPRIAVSTEKTAFAGEESYFVLETINDSINKMNFSLNLKLGSIAMMLGEFFEMNVRAMEREALLSNNTTGPGAGTTPQTRDTTPDDKREELGIGGLVTAGLAAMTVSDLDLNRYIEGSGLLTTLFTGITNSVKGIPLVRLSGEKLKPMSDFVKRIGSVFGVVSNVTKLPGFGLLSSVAKIFPFVRIFSGIVSFVQGFIDGYDEEGLFGGFKEGIATLAENFIGWPVNLLKDGLAYVLEKFGILTEEQKTSFNDFDFIKVIGDGVRLAFDWFKQLFTDPVGALKTLWEGYVGVYTSIGTWVYENVAKPAIDWLSSVFSWAGDIVTEGWTNLTDFVSGIWTGVKQWFVDKLTWASDTVTEGWTSLKDYVVTKFTEVKTWFTDKFNFAKDTAIAGWTGITGYVTDIIEDVKAWITDKLTWAGDTAVEGANFVSDIVTDAWESVKSWFLEKLGNIADVLPTVDDIKESLLKQLPGWMIPDAYKTPEQIAEASLNQIAEEQSMIARSKAGENVYYGFEESGRERSAERIAALEAELRETLSARGIGEAQINNIINQNFNSGGNTSSSTVAMVSGDGGSEYRPDK